MWEPLRFIVLLLMISGFIVTIDQFSKKGRYRKLWLSATVAVLSLFIIGESVSNSGLEFKFSNVTVENQTGQQANGEVPVKGDNTGSAHGKSENGSQNGGQTKGTAQNTGNTGVGKTTDDAGQTGQENQSTDGSLKDQPQPQPMLLFPVDEAGQKPDFRKFRESFAAAVKNKDLNFLKQHLSSDIRYSFGENNGLPGFLTEWKLDTSPDKSKIWPELSQLLSLGGTFNKAQTIFTAPYVFSKFPDTVNAFGYVAVIQANVNIYSRPDPNSNMIMGLSYTILKLADNQSYKSGSRIWKKIITPAGEEGFIDEKDVRSPVDYRAQFKQEDGRWKMIFLVTGD